jgi:hydroxyacylglutathione hydrolase/adenylyltransferase/sulfurtransferase
VSGAFSDTDTELSPERVRELLDAGEVQLVDVRETYEWDAGRIDGARHVEVAQLAGEAETIDRDRPVVFSCRSGSRSAMATQAFRRAGYDAYNLSGGILAWVDRGLPIGPDDSAFVAEH